MLPLQARRLAFTAAAAALALAALGGHSMAEEEGPVVINVDNPQRTLYAIAVPVGVDSDSKLAKEVAAVASFDLSVAGWFKVISPKSYLADLKKEKLGIVESKWKDVGAFGVIKNKVVKSGSKVTLTFKLYEVQKGNEAVLERTYKGKKGDIRKLTHKWCNEVF